MLLALSALALLAAQDPLAPGRDGMVQCYGPDVARKTCTAIGAYRFLPDGTIMNDAQNLLGGDPPAVMHATAKVYVRDGAECALIDNSEEHITAIDLDGVPLEGEQFLAIRKQLAQGMAAALGAGEFCSTYHPNPDGSLRATVTIDGVARPEFESTVLWINPADGWTLGR